MMKSLKMFYMELSKSSSVVTVSLLAAFSDSLVFLSSFLSFVIVHVDRKSHDENDKKLSKYRNHIQKLLKVIKMYEEMIPANHHVEPMTPMSVETFDF
jgi:hypothetical protein